MKRLPGEKTKRIYNELIAQYLPEDIENWIYVEPFGGTFAINTFLTKRPKQSIYNDINRYDFIDDIDADIIHHINYHDIINYYDSKDTIFYLDPPYYGKEYLYKKAITNQKDYPYFHAVLRNSLMNLQGKFVLSYEKCDFILKLYEDFNIFYYTGDYFPLRNEIIITNHTHKELRKLKLLELNDNT